MSDQAMTRKEHYTDGRRWSRISRAWIFDSQWNDKEEIAALREELAQRQGQIDTLANFILHSVPGEPSQSQGAVDTAIRVITTLREELAQVTQERDLVLAEAVWAIEQVVSAMLTSESYLKTERSDDESH
jgi:hypothetical protein